jgi:transitional endoplasmic reticulum ATPase
MSDNKLSRREKDELADLVDDDQDEIGQESTEQRNFRFDFQEPGHTFEEVVGMEDIKQELREKVQSPIQNKETYETYGLPGVVNGVILYGPPRTGKSFVAEGFAGETEFNFLKANAADIEGPKVGESEENLRQLIHQARSHQPSVVLLNEVEVLTSDRDQSDQTHKRDLVGTFLDEIEDLSGEDVVVIGTTNYIDRVDSAFIQPGRFSNSIWVGLPEQDTRRELLRTGLEKADDQKVDWDSVDLERISEVTEGYSCGDIVNEGLLYETKLKALNLESEITQKHLLYGFKKTSPSVENPDKYKRKTGERNAA